MLEWDLQRRLVSKNFGTEHEKDVVRYGVDIYGRKEKSVG